MTVYALDAIDCRPLARIRSGIDWWDVVTGGGLVRGSATLLHGSPGAGKSTALAQVAGGVPGALYVALEEHLSMVADRLRRVGARCQLSDDPGDIGAATSLAILDSVQLSGDDVVQTVERSVMLARQMGIAIVLVCHETKGGRYRGPTTIEHLVDVTLKIERDPRAIVCEKNRFGVAPCYLPLRMTERGLSYDKENDPRYAVAPAADHRQRARAFRHYERRYFRR